MARLEFDEHIDITVRLKIVSQDRAEQGQPLYVVPDAKRREGLWDRLKCKGSRPQ